MVTTTTLSALGARARVTVEEAQRIRKEWDATEGTPTVLSLKCRVWTVEALEPLVGCEKLSSVTELDLDDIIPSLPTDDGLATLSFIANVLLKDIQPIIIRCNDNATGIRGIKALQGLLSKQSLRELYLYNNGLSIEVTELFTEILNFENMRVMDFGRNQMGPRGAHFVAQLLSPQLQELFYAGSRPLLEGTAYLCQGLKKSMPSLVKLDLNDCSLVGQQGAQYTPLQDLLPVLQHSQETLQLLRLMDGGLGEDGVEELVQALEEATTLVDLSLEANDLEEDGTRTLANDLISRQTSLRVLNLNTNIIGEAITELLTALIPSSATLQELYLQGNDLEDYATAFLECSFPALQKLDLQDNMIEDEDLIRQLDEKFGEGVVLVDPDVRDAMEASSNNNNDDDDAQVDELAAALQQTSV